MFIESFYLYKNAKRHLDLLEKYQAAPPKMPNTPGSDSDNKQAAATIAASGLFFTIALVLGLCGIAIWLWALYDIITNCPNANNERTLQLVLIFNIMKLFII